MTLSTKQVVFLRGLGQSLKPQLHIGREGSTPAMRSALDDLFRRRELVKVRVLKTAGERARDIAAGLAAEVEAVLVGVVGGTFVLYRPNPDLKDRIQLP